MMIWVILLSLIFLIFGLVYLTQQTIYKSIEVTSLKESSMFPFGTKKKSNLINDISIDNHSVEKFEEKKRILVLSEPNKFTNSINKTYTDKYGYDFKIVYKINYEIIQDQLGKYDYILTTYGVFINFDKNLESLLRIARNTDLLICREYHLPQINRITPSSDVMIWKNSSWSRDILSQLSEKTRTVFSTYGTLSAHVTELDDLSYNKAGHKLEESWVLSDVNNNILSDILENELDGILEKNLSLKLDLGIPIKTQHITIFNEDVFNSEHSPFLLNLNKRDVNYQKYVLERLYNRLQKQHYLTNNISNIIPNYKINQIFPWGNNFGGPTLQEILPFYEHIQTPSPTKDTTQGIPYTIIQTYETSVVPEQMYKACQEWRSKNPTYNYQFFDDSDCRQFLVDNFSPNTVNAFDSLIPGAYKADLFRYCVLYIQGGVYADSDMFPLVNLADIIDDNYDFISVKDRPENAIFNAFICCTAKHPFIKRAIDMAVDNINYRYYGNSSLSITGPLLLYQAIISILGHDLTKAGKYDENGYKFKLLIHPQTGNEVVDINGKPLINTKFFDTRDLYKLGAKQHYGYYWNKNMVYK